MNDRPGRRARVMLWVLLALLLLAAGFAGARWWWLNRGRYRADPTLLAELADVTFDDDPAPAADWPPWTSQDGSAGYSSPVAATIGDVRQVLFLTGTQLVGVTPEAGERLWSYEWTNRFEVNAATPLVIHGRNKSGDRVTYVFISSGYGRGCALLKIDARGGRFAARPVYTSGELRVHFSSPVRYNDHIYAFDESEDLTCWDLRAGKVAWRFDRGGEGASSIRRRVYGKGSLLRVSDALIAYGDTAKLARVACDPAGYRELSAFLAFRNAQQSWAMPAFAGGKLLVRDRRKVMCLDLATPKE